MNRHPFHACFFCMCGALLHVKYEFNINDSMLMEMCGFFLLCLCMRLAYLTRCFWDAFPVWINEFCDQLFGSMNGFSIQCCTSSFWFCILWVLRTAVKWPALVCLDCVRMYVFVFSCVVSFSHKDFLIAPTGFSVWHRGVSRCSTG